MTTLSSLLDAAALRAQVHAGNIAHQNTPGYKARAVDFEEAFRAALAEGGADAAAQVTPSIIEPHATMEQSDGNDVSLDYEISTLAKNATMYNACIQMLRGKMQILTSAASAAP